MDKMEYLQSCLLQYWRLSQITSPTSVTPCLDRCQWFTERGKVANDTCGLEHAMYGSPKTEGSRLELESEETCATVAS